jgi:hypothetical protein
MATASTVIAAVMASAVVAAARFMTATAAAMTLGERSSARIQTNRNHSGTAQCN